MSPDELVDENNPSTWVAKTKVAPVKFTKGFLFFMKKVPLSHTLFRTLHLFAFSYLERNP